MSSRHTGRRQRVPGLHPKLGRSGEDQRDVGRALIGLALAEEAVIAEQSRRDRW